MSGSIDTANMVIFSSLPLCGMACKMACKRGVGVYMKVRRRVDMEEMSVSVKKKKRW